MAFAMGGRFVGCEPSCESETLVELCSAQHRSSWGHLSWIADYPWVEALPTCLDGPARMIHRLALKLNPHVHAVFLDVAYRDKGADLPLPSSAAELFPQQKSVPFVIPRAGVEGLASTSLQSESTFMRTGEHVPPRRLLSWSDRKNRAHPALARAKRPGPKTRASLSTLARSGFFGLALLLGVLA